jgi:hypothetical protein
MKKLIFLLLISSILFSQEAFCNNNTNLYPISEMNDSVEFDLHEDPKFGITIKLGKKLLESNQYNTVDAALWFGLGLGFKISKHFTIGPEINFWKSNEYGYNLNYEIKTRETLLLIYFNEAYGDHIFNILFGIGGLNVDSKFSSGSNSKDLLSINVGGSYGLNIFNNFNCYIQARRQFAGSISLGGGASYNSWLASLVIELKI